MSVPSGTAASCVVFIAIEDDICVESFHDADSVYFFRVEIRVFFLLLGLFVDGINVFSPSRDSFFVLVQSSFLPCLFFGAEHEFRGLEFLICIDGGMGGNRDV